MSRFRHHIFVCQNERACGSRPSCGARGARDLLRALEKRIAEDEQLHVHTAVTASGCLGPCFDGPMVVIYPQAIWYRTVRGGDIEEIVRRHLIGGETVERLCYKWPEEE